MLIQVIGKFPFVLFLLAIVLSVLRYADSDYPFGIFKLFFAMHGIFFYFSCVCGISPYWTRVAEFYIAFESSTLLIIYITLLFVYWT
jgi:hypothetical protein